MNGIWDNGEVQNLFALVEECKRKNRALREAFIAHAQKYNRKPNSVRNYYYHEVDTLQNDQTRCKQLGINLKNHKKSEITYFSKEEENSLMQQIYKMVEEGSSVRKACFVLSNGDVGQMLRFQNKYRNFLAKRTQTEKPNNVVTFQKATKRLTDGEVQSLFMGLVRLVKKNALIEGEERYKAELTSANAMLRRALAQINTQEREIEKLKEDFSRIKQENLKLAQNAIKNTCRKAEALRAKLENGENVL